MDGVKRDLLQAYTGCAIASLEYLPGGCVGEVWLVVFEDGQKLVAKTSQGASHLDVEGRMLDYLRHHSDLPVPQVVITQSDFLAMQYIASETGKTRHSSHLAHYIADLHAISADNYGLEWDTLIGPLPQVNTQDDCWLNFFAEKRLSYMARLAFDHGGVSGAFCRKLDKLLGRLSDYLSEPARPSLLHGDLWFGNVIWTATGSIAFIDPAIYYGDAEIEIAYSQMFGGIGDNFLNEYDSLRPLSANFTSERAPIYQLYPLLVHARLFGGGYGIQADAIIDRFV